VAKDAHLPAGRVLVVGLGNPGPDYARTRHNVGWLVIDELARRWSIDLGERKFKALLGSGQIRSTPAVLLEPQTFMNLSGEAVGPAAGFWRLAPESIVALHDDIDLAPGVIRLKQGGGHGGHNGLRSMDQHLPSNNYFRIRLGVGRPVHGEVTNWVLSRFAVAEQSIVDHLVNNGADAVEGLIADGLLATQNRIHTLRPT
jgi:PTH1 family peptidyl-tRNA hydrolase